MSNFLKSLKQKFSDAWLKLSVNLYERSRSESPPFLYALAAATALAPVVTASNFAVAFGNLTLLLGGLGIEALGNLLEELRTKDSEAERVRLLETAAKNSTEVRDAIDLLLEKVEALPLAQQAFNETKTGKKEREWFVEAMQASLQQAGSRLRIDAKIDAGRKSAVATGKTAAAATTGGVAVGTIHAQNVTIITEAAKHNAQLADSEQRYLDFVRREHGRIRLFGFLSHANIDVRLLDVFVSLRLAEYGREMEMKHLPRLSLANSEKKGRGLPAPESREDRLLNPAEVLQRAVRKQKSLLVLGGPGSGKTTLLKYFAVCCLDPQGRERLRLHNSLVPIFAPLRQIDPAKPFAEALAAWAKKHNQPLSAERFATWLHEPGALVLLDGLDEVSDLAQRRQICDWIDKAVPTYGASTFVVTCRFTGYREAEGVALQSSHLRADVLDLDAGQQQTFLQQWFHAARRESLEAREAEAPERLQDIDRSAAAEAGAVAEFLGREENRSLRDMASIPVLLQIMAIIWKEQGSLAGERVELYSRCMDFLLDHRDQAKKIEPLVSAAKARLVLRPLALWMHADWQKDEAPRVEVEKQIADKLQAVRPGTAALEFLENLRDRAGVLVGSGADTYTFQHKSFREFLAALEIANRNDVEMLVENFGSDWWQETLLFSAGLTSPEIFPAFIESFLKHDKNAGPTSPLLLQLVREAADKPLAPFEKIIRNQKLAWQKRYNALQCVRLWRRPGGVSVPEAATALLQAARQDDKEPKVRQLAEQILIEWAVIKPPASADEKPNRFFNPLEDNAEYILIPGGKYKFSATKELVQVPDLYVAKYPVTNKLYNIFLASLPESEREKHRSKYADDKRFNGDDQPVVDVNWHSAKAYCEWLTVETFRRNVSTGFRLPTEIEWEWAASGGKREYPWGNEAPDKTRANYDLHVGHTTPVGAYPAGATPEGLMDMAGNVWEWMETWYDRGENSRVLRGGSWVKYPQDVRCASRGGYEPTDRYSYVGFRCAQDVR